jgi:hypothetical protein
MPRLIDPGPVPSPLGPEEAVATLEAMRFDPQAPGAWDEAAPVLAALSADRGFLGRRAVAILAGRGGGEGVARQKSATETPRQKFTLNRVKWAA